MSWRTLFSFKYFALFIIDLRADNNVVILKFDGKKQLYGLYRVKGIIMRKFMFLLHISNHSIQTVSPLRIYYLQNPKNVQWCRHRRPGVVRCIRRSTRHTPPPGTPHGGRYFKREVQCIIFWLFGLKLHSITSSKLDRDLLEKKSI